MNKLPTEKQIDKVLCERSFFYFVQYFWRIVVPEKAVWNWHIEYICNELQEVVERVIRREEKLYDIIINVPPGTSKSTICTIMLPAWAWTRDATLRTMTSSYSAGLSLDHSTKSRDIIKSKEYRELWGDVQIRWDIDGKGKFKNTKGGERYATSVGGTVTGFHAHLLVVDDPIDASGADSAADRATANLFMDRTLSTRKVDKGITPTILVMQRLHADDPTGNWLSKRKDIKHICLPAEISEDIKPRELIENYQDGMLDPVRMNRNVLEQMRTALGSYGYAGQFMQTPAPIGGGIWQKWFIPVEDHEFPDKLQKLGSDWDLAYTEKETNSASAFVTAGMKGNDMYIDDLGWKWLEFPKLIEWMRTRTAPHYIENKAAGKSAKQVLKGNGIPAIEVNVQGGDKTARATMASPYAEAGLIYIRKSLVHKLYYDSRQGILLFPNGEADDLNDALVQSINRLLIKNRNQVRSSNVF